MGQEPTPIEPGAHVEQPGEQPLLTVAIATYDGRELLEGVLASLQGQKIADRTHIVVIDDHSSDGTAAWLRERWPAVELIAHDRNLGVSRSLNEGLGVARGEFLALLNNDVELEPDCLELLVEELRAHPEAAVSSPKLLDFHDRGRLDGAGDVYTWWGMANRRGHGELDRGQYDTAEAVFGASAAVAVYRRSAIERVGGLDEQFFAYLEDVDWSMRALLAGLQCRYQPRAVAYHMGSATLGAGPSEFNLFHIWRNGVWVIAKDLPASLILLHLPQLLVGQLWHLAGAVRHRRLGVWARAWAEALRGLPAMLAKRRTIQAERAIAPRELGRWISRR
ncbi:MAG: glycosyltransferase family 2 protein [Solirubrobacteraceae bacterium]